jgi:hypothetical protein
MGTQRPAGGDRFSQGLPSQLPATGSGARPSAGQLPARDSGRLSQAQRPSQQPAGSRGQNLTSSQKDQLRQKYQESGGLKPSQLPGNNQQDRQGQRDQNRQDLQDQRDQNQQDRQGQRDQTREDFSNNREQAREDWQNQMNQSREDWQDWYEDEYHDHWDDHWYSPWWYGYPVSTVSYSFYMDNSPPCSKTVVINQATGQSTYYYCNSVWYQPAYNAGEVKYIVTAPPAGAELTTLSDPYKVTVGGQDYFVSSHVFYQKVIRNGQTLYITVDAPPGARVPTIPEYAVEIEHAGKSYYRFDKIFYQKQGDFFLVVNNPGV